MTTADDTSVPIYPELLRLDDRGFVVVGAGQGNGRQNVHAPASVGARSLCVDIDRGLAEEVAAEVDGFACVADATNAADVERLLAEAQQQQLGRVHGICDVVGMARWAALVDMPDEDWDWNFDMVLRHAFLLTKHGARIMAADGGGCISFVASISGVRSSPFHGGYGAAKAGLLSLVRTAAVELAAANVRVTAVVPGGIATPHLARALGVDLDAATDGALRSPARTSDIASALLFLRSELARHVTGHALTAILSSTPIRFRGHWCRPAKRWVPLATAKRLAQLRRDACDSNNEPSRARSLSSRRPQPLVMAVKDILRSVLPDRDLVVVQADPLADAVVRQTIGGRQCEAGPLRDTRLNRGRPQTPLDRHAATH